jgi:hypothetical protein
MWMYLGLLAALFFRHNLVKNTPFKGNEVFSCSTRYPPIRLSIISSYLSRIYVFLYRHYMEKINFSSLIFARTHGFILIKSAIMANFLAIGLSSFKAFI